MGPTLLIGIDGATFTVLDPYIERGVTPFLGELARRGTRAELRSIVPALTPPAWTSLVTGKRPAARRLRLLPEGGAGQHPLPVHELAGDPQRDDLVARQRPGAARDLAQLPADVPAAAGGRLHRAGRDDALAPAATRLPPARALRPAEGFAGFNPRQMLDMELEIKAIEGCPEDEQSAWVELHIKREQRWFEVARHLIQEEPADLIGVMFDGVDKLQHLCWRFIDPACRPAALAGSAR